MVFVQKEIKRVTMRPNGDISRLPSAYQEVEYIESSLGQYIDTGFYPTGTSAIDIDFQWNYHNGIFGVDSGWQNKAFSLFQDRIICYGTQAQSQQNYFTSGNRYRIIFNSSRQCYVNNVLKYTYSSETFTSSYSAYVFGKRRNNSVESYSAMKLYSLKLWNNGTLERNFVPCYRKADSVIGLYDLVNNQFYTNSGGGTFTKGSNITGEKQIRPTATNWTLFTETDLSTNNLGLLTAETTSWDGQYARTLASITNDGQGNYYYQTQQRTPVNLRLRANYPTLRQIPSGKSNRKIKRVCDYLSATSTNVQIEMGRKNRDSYYRNCMTTETSGYNQRRTGYSANVVYTAETILDVAANTEQGTIYLKSNGTVAHTFGPFTLATGQSGTYYENDCWLGYGTDTNTSNVRLGNVHIYYMDI